VLIKALFPRPEMRTQLSSTSFNAIQPRRIRPTLCIWERHELTDQIENIGLKYHNAHKTLYTNIAVIPRGGALNTTSYNLIGGGFMLFFFNGNSRRCLWPELLDEFVCPMSLIRNHLNSAERRRDCIFIKATPPASSGVCENDPL